MRTEKYSDASVFFQGVANLRRGGLTPRGLLFLALDPAGAVHLSVPNDVEEVTKIKVGQKLSLPQPSEGRFFHYDSIHRLRSNQFLFNGDRRLQHPGDASQTAWVVADFLKASSARNVFFGCTPHQPGSWFVNEKGTMPFHEAGFCEIVPVHIGLLARRVMDHRLWLRTSVSLATNEKLDDWEPIFESELGNVLMLERRAVNDRLVLTCERGLVEVDIASVPVVSERDRVEIQTGFAVVGRVENTAFAVTQGKVEPWGLDGIRPAVLVGATGNSLAALAEALRSGAE